MTHAFWALLAGKGVPSSIPSRTRTITDEKAQPLLLLTALHPLGWVPKPPRTVKCHQGCVSDVLCTGYVISPLFCVSLSRPLSGLGGGTGDDFGTYFSFSLTTGGLKVSGAEGAAWGWQGWLYRSRRTRPAPQILIEVQLLARVWSRTQQLRAPWPQPFSQHWLTASGPGRQARTLPSDLQEAGSAPRDPAVW